MTVMSYLGAIGAAQREAMLADERVVIIGEDVEANVYGTTGGSGKSRAASGDFLEMFGANRIRNTPISEEVIVGACAGAAMTGLRPIVDLSYSSFLYMAMDQFVNQDIVHYPQRHELQPMRQADRPRARRARSPALLLVGHPVH